MLTGLSARGLGWGVGAASSPATAELALLFLTCREEEFGASKKEACGSTVRELVPSCVVTAHALPLGEDPTEKGRLWSLKGQCCRARPLLGNLRPASASRACWNQQKTIPPTPGKPFLSLLQAALAPWHCRTPGLWEEGFLGASWGSEAVNITREGRGGGKRGPEASRAAASSPDSPGSSLCGVWSGVHETSARLEVTQVAWW